MLENIVLFDQILSDEESLGYIQEARPSYMMYEEYETLVEAGKTKGFDVEMTDLNMQIYY